MFQLLLRFGRCIARTQQISDCEQTACTRVSRPPRRAARKHVCGVHLTTARARYRVVRAFFGEAQVDDVPEW